MTKPIPLSRLKRKRQYKELDTVASSKSDTRKGMDMIFEAQTYYNCLDYARRQAHRCKDYQLGRQWSDRVFVDGAWMTEEDYIKQQGSVPLQQNLMRRLTRNVLGQFRQYAKEPTCSCADHDEAIYGEAMNVLLGHNYELNRRKEMDARELDEYLNSGAAIYKKRHCWENNKLDIFTYKVDFDYFFIDNKFRDPRGWDCQMVGQIHDVSFESVCRDFAKSKEQYEILAREFHFARNKAYVTNNYERFGNRKLENIDFLLPSDPTQCRVIEIWSREQKERYHCWDPLKGEELTVNAEDLKTVVLDENENRRQMYLDAGITDEDDMALIIYEDIYDNGSLGWFIDSYWYCRYVTPTGTILKEFESPFKHKKHPYIFKFYPMLGGEVASFVSDYLDQQRYINRLITMYDWIMRSSAKGLLMIPEDCLSDQMSLDEIAENWAKFGGVIIYKAKPGVEAPHQISANSVNIGITELLNIQMRYMEEISGVNAALQGKQAYGGMSGTLYAQQTQNAANSLLDILFTYNDFLDECAEADIEMIKQYYDKDKIRKILGSKSKFADIDYDKLLRLEYDVNLIDGTDSRYAEQENRNYLMQLLGMNAITLEQMLDAGEFSFGEDLKRAIKANQESAQSGAPMFSPELTQQAQQGANMNAVNQLYNALRAA